MKERMLRRRLRGKTKPEREPEEGGERKVRRWERVCTGTDKERVIDDKIYGLYWNINNFSYWVFMGTGDRKQANK